jgi:hypothetical protein
MAANNPAVRRTSALIANFDRWSKVDDRQAATAPARRGFMARFEKQVDPNGELSDDERARRAELAMRAHMSRLALAKARKRAVA